MTVSRPRSNSLGVRGIVISGFSTNSLANCWMAEYLLGGITAATSNPHCLLLRPRILPLFAAHRTTKRSSNLTQETPVDP